jgi:Zn-dependent protease
MDFLLIDTILYYVYLAIILLVSIGLHEYAHAWSSHKLGDPTPALQGRLTPNPFKHVDPIGFVMIFLIRFGRGKPVQINPSYYKRPMRDELLSSLAGPAMNLVLAFIGLFIMMLYATLMGISANELMSYQFDMITRFWWMFTTVNISLAVFNLLPIPPLDGYRLIGVFSKKAFLWMRTYSHYIMIGLLVLIFLPGVNLIGTYIMTVSDVIYRFFFMILSLIFY